MADGEEISVVEPIVSDLDSAETRLEEKPLKLQLSDLIDDARSLAMAEVEYYKTKLSVNMAATKRVLVLFAISCALGLTAIMTLILGLLLIAQAYIGPIGATIVVAGSTFLLAAMLMRMSVKRARKLPLDEKDL